MKRGRSHTIRSRLALLVVSCLIPACLMAAALLAYGYQRERARLERDSVAMARALTAAMDRELSGVQSALYALATSPHLSSNDLRAFHAQAKEVLPNLIATSVLLIDASGQQRINTLRAFGETLPFNGSRQVQSMFKTGRPVTTDLFPGPVFGRPLVAVGVPVRREGKVVYLLSTAIVPERLSGILTQQRLPADWIAAIFDGTGTTVSRTHDMGRFLGKKGNPALLKRMGEVTEGAIEVTTLEGVPALAVFSRSAVSNWTVAIAIPMRDLTGELWELLWWLGLGLALLLLGSFAMAWTIGGRIRHSVRALSAPALALGLGNSVMVPALHLKEVDEVGQALMRASRMLQEARHRGHHDALTGLANRVLFDEIVDHQVAICSRSGMRLAILYVDLDEFKAVNDAHGHATGDALLCAVAARLTTGLRTSDLAARMGGDEFAVVLVNTAGEQAAVVAENLAKRISMPYPIGSLTVEISASIGVAVFPDEGSSTGDLLHRADEKMYRAKSGRQRRIIPSGTLEAA